MRLGICIALALIVCLAGPGVPCGSAGPSEPGRTRDVAQLLDGVKKIDVPGVPGTISVFGEQAFPVVVAEVGGQPTPVVAAARLGKGRMVVLSHNGWFGGSLKKADTARLLCNACRWAAGKPTWGSKGPVIAVGRWRELPGVLEAGGLRVERVTGRDWTRALAKADVLCAPISDMDAAAAKALRRFVERGGGLVCGLPGWGWKQLNPKKDLATENLGNRLLARAGLIWGSDLIKKPKNARLAAGAQPPAFTHAGLALDALVAQSEKRSKLGKKESALAVATVTRCIRDLPPDDVLLLPRLGKLLKHAGDPRFLPTAKSPLTDGSGLGKLLLTLQIRRNRELPVEKVKAHGAAVHFPGAVPRNAKRIRRTVTIDTSVPDWHGTGLYAAPGEVVTVHAPKALAAAGLTLRIGAHKDRLWGKAKWRRVPEITRTFPIGPGETRGVNAFGGPVYIVVPKRAKPGVFELEISGAVEAPRFVLGETSGADWRNTIRAHPAPWAELESQNVIITVPSQHVRKLDDPEALMIFWNRVLDADADLATLPHERTRPERFVADEQISAGYMHAGYPIMTHLDAAPRFVDLGRLSTQGDWGMFHELGHNHQHRDWTFGGTVEVTCNLFSLYVMETVCSKGIGHKAMSAESIARNEALFRKGGRSFDYWKRKPFTALIMYYQLKQAFGWAAFQEVFAEYRALPAGERPRTDAEKRDQWMVRFARTVGRDLGPFFEAWNVPVSEQARKSIADLPAWMPGEKR